MTAIELSESYLVERSRGGDARAFEEIVRRHISAVFATAYALTGDRSTSDDVTQEAFLLAWQRLRQLDQPEKLRAWLCAIARNVARAGHRSGHTDPLRTASPLEPERLVSAAPRPDEQAVAAERQRLVWSALESIPEEYRVPLVLYYRQEQSTREVAATLDLTEDAVRQRLSRARSMLKQEVQSLVETTLETTAPSPAVVAGIVAGLAVTTSHASAAAALAGAGKLSGGVTAAGMGAAVVGSLAGPMIGIAGGLYGAHQSMKNAKSPEERHLLKRLLWQTSLLVLVWLTALAALIVAAARQAITPNQTFVLGALNLGLYVTVLLVLILRTNRKVFAMRQLHGEEGLPQLRGARRMEEFARTSPRQWRICLIGFFGGGVFGSVAWMFPTAALAGQWTLFFSTLAFAALTVAVAVQQTFRKPRRYWLHAAIAALVLLVYTHAALGLAWSPGLERVLTEHNRWDALSPRVFRYLAEGILLLFAVIALAVHAAWNRRGEPQPS